MKTPCAHGIRARAHKSGKFYAAMEKLQRTADPRVNVTAPLQGESR
jgi:hypothetical protein